jgi:hypothetical protein
MFRQVRPRLWRWEVTHPEWTPEEGADGGWDPVVASYAAVADDTLILVDPLAPPDGTDEARRFWAALDDDVEHHGQPATLLTIFWHARSTGAVLARYSAASVWAYGPAATLVGERTRYTDTFVAGQQLPGGAVPYDAGQALEVVFWLPSHRALVAGDVLLGAGAGAARLCPESWLGEGKTHEDVRAALRPILDLPVELLLLTHGEVIAEDARGALERALG